MTTENDRIIVKREIFNGQGDLSMHEQAMREDKLVYEASHSKQSWSDDTDSCTFLSDMSKFLLQTPTAFSSDQFDILHLQVINPKFHPCVFVLSSPTSSGEGLLISSTYTCSFYYKYLHAWTYMKLSLNFTVTKGGNECTLKTFFLHHTTWFQNLHINCCKWCQSLSSAYCS